MPTDRRIAAVLLCASPLSLAVGFDLVMVNGRIARVDGALTGELSGRVLMPDGSG